ncbi:hypothetical protein ACUHGC_02535 [Testudinibacter sp. P27/CKL/0425]
MNNTLWQVVRYTENNKPSIVGSDSDIQTVLNIIKRTLENHDPALTAIAVKKIQPPA